MSAQPSPKRRKTGHGSAPVKDLYEARADLYYDDGNIIIAAEDAAFKVHRTILSQHSQVFKDMFVMDSAAEEGEIFDGCPVVRVSEKPRHMGFFLQAIYGVIKMDDELEWEDAECLVIVARRYAADGILEDLKSCLDRLVPITLKEFDAKWASGDNAWVYYGTRYLEMIVADEDLPHLTSCLCILYYIDLHEDGMWRPREIVPRYFRGLTLLSTEVPRFIFKVIAPKADGSACCQKAWQQILREAQQDCLMTGKFLRQHHPLDFIRDLPQRRAGRELCWECFIGFKDSAQRYREDLWSRLPQIFELGDSWEKWHTYCNQWE
ncbi:hypothetical protein M422DRAFT_42147 [Sphaerobolus stellatus SS14]|nr:hypothetical protein M422DRAFT_42147 [Sphaerobolus stellatus SS14]